MVGGWRPEQARTWLHFPSGEIVVFELRAEREPQSVFDDRDLILHKSAQEIQRARIRVQRRGCRLSRIVARHAIAGAPDHCVARAQLELVLEVDVERVPLLREN